MNKIQKIILSLILINYIQLQISSDSVQQYNPVDNIDEQQREGNSKDPIDQNQNSIVKWAKENPKSTMTIGAFGTVFIAGVVDQVTTNGKGRKKLRKIIFGENIATDKKDEKKQEEKQSSKDPIKHQPGSSPNPIIKKIDHTNQRISYQLRNPSLFDTFQKNFTGKQLKLFNLMMDLEEHLSDATIVFNYLEQDPLKINLLNQLKNEFKNTVGVVLEKDQNDPNQRTQLGFYYSESFMDINKELKQPSIGMIFDQLKSAYTAGKFTEEMVIHNDPKIYSEDNVKKSIKFIKKHMAKIEEFNSKNLLNFLTQNNDIQLYLKDIKNCNSLIKQQIEKLFIDCLSTNQVFIDALKKDFAKHIKSIDAYTQDANYKKIKIKETLYEDIKVIDQWIYDIASNDGYFPMKKLQNIDIDTADQEEIFKNLIKAKYNLNQVNWDSEKHIGFKDDNLLDFLWVKRFDFPKQDWELQRRVQYFTEYMTYIKKLFKELYLIHKNYKTSSDLNAPDFQKFLVDKTKELEALLTKTHGKTVVIHWDQINLSKKGDYNIIIKGNSITDNKQDPAQLKNYDFFISEPVIVEIVRSSGSQDYTLSSNFFANPWLDVKNTIEICKIKLDKKSLDAIHKSIIAKAESDSNIKMTLAQEKKFNDSLINQIKKVMANPQLASKITAKKTADKNSADNKILDWINFLCIINQASFNQTNFDATMKSFNFDPTEITAIQAIQASLKTK